MPQSPVCGSARRSSHGSVTWAHICASEQGEANLPFLLGSFCSACWLAPGVLHLRACWGWRGLDPSGWEGLLGGEPPEGILVFIKQGDSDLCFYKLHRPVASRAGWPQLRVHLMIGPPASILFWVPKAPSLLQGTVGLIHSWVPSAQHGAWPRTRALGMLVERINAFLKSHQSAIFIISRAR